MPFTFPTTRLEVNWLESNRNAVDVSKPGDGRLAVSRTAPQPQVLGLHSTTLRHHKY